MADHSEPPAPARVHRAARTEDKVHAVIERVLRRRGWRPRVVPYAGYGNAGWVRVLGRVLLTPPGTKRRDIERARGWRRFLSATVTDVEVTIGLGPARHVVTTTRGGYVDVVLPAHLPPGWAYATMSADGGDASAATRAPLRIVGPDARLGIVSDIDDTVMVTALPRPLLAFWNTFLRHETARRAVPGMARMFFELLESDPDAFVVYLSTGAWNVAPALEAFLARHGLPRGPLLLTDWGPTTVGWFRSGREHKRAALRRLLNDLPQLQWIFVGDDGQHDPVVYEEAAAAAPGRVEAVAIRQLTPAEQVLTHGTPEPLSDHAPAGGAPCVDVLRAGDGYGLLAALRTHGACAPRSVPRSGEARRGEA